MKNYITTAIQSVINDNLRKMEHSNEDFHSNFDVFFTISSHAHYLAYKENKILSFTLKCLEEEGYTRENIINHLDNNINYFNRELTEITPLRESTNMMANIAHIMDREVYQHLYRLYTSLRYNVIHH